MGNQTDSRLAEIFADLNMSDFPALKEHALAIRKLAGSANATMQETLALCQKDYGLTAKLLREANSAFYSHTRPVCSVVAAAGRLGLAAINVHLGGVLVLEEVAGMVGEREVVPLIAKSFLSACLARAICAAKRYAFHPDEAFSAGLLHNMGKLAALLFLPDRHRRVLALMRDGATADEAARQVFYGLSYPELGMELGRFWNLPEPLVTAMVENPPEPKGINDPEGIMQCLASFSNQLVDGVCEDGRTNILFDRYGKCLGLGKEETLKLLNGAVEEAKASGQVYRQCLLGYKLGGKIRRMESLLAGSLRKQVATGEEETAGRAMGDSVGTAGSPVQEFFAQINRALQEQVRFGDFAAIVLDAICKGTGLDRVLLASLETAGADMHLQGRFGAGAILPEQIQGFRYSLEDPGDIFFEILTLRRDTAVTVDWQTPLAGEIKNEFFGWSLHVMLLGQENAPAGLLILARRPGRLPLSASQLQAASAFRDLLLMGLRRDPQGLARG